jgi:hypothetical protein
MASSTGGSAANADKNIHGRLLSFKANSNLDYARPNLFQVDIEFPTAVAATLSSSAAGGAAAATGGSATGLPSDMKKLAGYTIKAANLPASTIGVVEVPFRGRMLKIAGDRTFEPWTITINNDTAFRLRSAFEKWMECIQLYEENATALGYGTSPFGGTGGGSTAVDYLNYMSNMKVTQLDRRGNAIRTYQFYQVWPSNVAAIDLDFGSNDAIEEFTVELQVQYWAPVQAGVDNQIDPSA